MRPIVVFLTAIVILTAPVIRQPVGFPQLRSFDVIAPASDDYNCIAWSVGLTDRWLWHDSGTLDAADQLNAQFGYRRLPTLDYSPGDKILAYGVGNTVLHQCRMVDGRWTSKIGRDRVIRFDHPEALTGRDYGRPLAVYVREPANEREPMLSAQRE